MDFSAMNLNYFDVAVVSILVLFTLRGFLRGFVGEVAGVVAIVGGLWFAHRFSPQVAVYLDFVRDPLWRNVLAYALTFLAILLLVGLTARVLQKILSFSFVSWADKLAGAALGLVKGLVICSVLLLLAQRFLSDAAFMRESRVLPYLNSVMHQVRAYLPPDLVDKFTL